MKKVFGVILCVIGAMALFGAVLNSAWYIGYGDGAALFGYITGQLLALVGFFGGGIFFCLFDRIYKRDYATGYRMRKKQNVWIVVFFVYFFVILMISFYGALITVEAYSFWERICKVFLLTLIYWIPWVGFTVLLGTYTVGFCSCRKNNGLGDAVADGDLLEPSRFRSLCPDESVLTDGEILFFPKLFCVIPFERIASVKYVNIIIEKSIVITFSNGKKTELAYKNYDVIQGAIEEYKDRTNGNNM